ncbi:MAG: glycosyltransferase [Rhizobiales bacterium]|nr:glycosyltransferase [Hyphomicrobiales bacterium]
MDPIGKGVPIGSDNAADGPAAAPDHSDLAHEATGEYIPPSLQISPDDLEFARQESRKTGTDLASVLVAYGMISPQAYCRQMSQNAWLPYLREPSLRRAAAVCEPSSIAQISRTGRIPASWDPAATRYAAALPSSSRSSRACAHDVVAMTTRQELGDAIRHTFRQQLCEDAALGLATRVPEFSAAWRLSGRQAVFALFVALCVFLALIGAPHATLWVLTLALTGFFLSVIVLRCVVLWPPVGSPLHTRPPRVLSDDELPTYSVLVPLFGEANMVPQLLDALCALDYPAALLDIKLILEEGDRATRNMVAAHQLPGCFEVIMVPSCWPQTKPKALNFALPFASGELLTIFDAEDVPEPKQLRDAAVLLASDPTNLACVQASLTFYNAKQNWMTRQFTLEYACLFDVILPVLAAYRQPLPLGGTSNHFRTSVLREAGGWDPHNVTEDADLGVRLDRLGYRVDVLDSTTYEEATHSLGNWLRQRSRWLKGWMQTWLVHMRSPLCTWREMGPAGFAVFQVLMGGMVVSALVHPFFLAAVLYGLAAGTLWPTTMSISQVFLFALQAVVLLVGYGVMMLIGRRACAIRQLTGFKASIPAMPIYWLLGSVAGWYAVWQLLTAPFYWEKTRHGPRRDQRDPGS